MIKGMSLPSRARASMCKTFKFLAIFLFLFDFFVLLIVVVVVQVYRAEGENAEHTEYWYLYHSVQ